MNATCTLTKKALIRKPGFPIGQPAPLFIDCCGNELNQPEAGATVKCPVCGNEYDRHGWVVEREGGDQ